MVPLTVHYHHAKAVDFLLFQVKEMWTTDGARFWNFLLCTKLGMVSLFLQRTASKYTIYTRVAVHVSVNRSCSYMSGDVHIG
jgi:hypothetical protein